MKKILVVLTSIALLGCASQKSVIKSQKIESGEYSVTVEQMSFESREIAKGSVETRNEGNVSILLPGNYDTSGKDYAVVYYLNGHSGNNREFERAQAAYINYNRENPDRELIVVAVNGYGPYRGSFYADSKITGNWESYFLKEVMPRVEKEYRIKREKESRGLAGFSMGGSCTLNIALKRSDLFGAIYALSPGVISGLDQLEIAVKDWKAYTDDFRKGYTCAYAEEELDYPQFDNTSEDKALINKWLIGYGSYQQRVEEYLKGRERINRIMIVYGFYDYYSWIPEGSRWLYEHMSGLELPVELYKHDGGHDFNSNIVEESMLPFFGEALQ